jgi:hypothetical protein
LCCFAEVVHLAKDVIFFAASQKLTHLAR